MKALTDYITEKLKISKSMQCHKYQPKTKSELKQLMEHLIKERGIKADLNDIDVSEITDMSKLFNYSGDSGKLYIFNGDISQWDVSNVKDMSLVFWNSQFNGDISQWDVSNATTMKRMFFNSKFNRDISNWNVSNVKDMSFMFYESHFNGDISNWDVGNVEDMERMFDNCPLQNNPPKWYK